MAELKYLAPLLSEVDFNNLEPDANYVVKVDKTDNALLFTTTDGTTGPITPVSGFGDPYNLNGKLLNFYSKVLSGSSINGTSSSRNGQMQLVVMICGDSVSGYKPSPLYSNLRTLFGQSGEYHFPGSGAVLEATGNPTFHSNVEETEWFHNGNWVVLNSAGDAIKFGIGRTYSTHQGMCYIQTPGGGTFKIQINDGSGWSDAGTVNTDGSKQGKVFEVVKAPGKYQMRIEKISGGPIYLIGAIQKNLSPDSVGVGLCNFGRGGLNFFNHTVSNETKRINLPIFEYIGADLLIMEYKEINAVDVPNKIEPFLLSVKEACPKTDFLICSTTPDFGNPGEIKKQNSYTKLMCMNNGWAFIDSEGPMVSIEAMTSVGWNGDGTHPAAATGFLIAGQIWAALGLDTLPTVRPPFGIMGDYHASLNQFRRLYFNNADNDKQSHGWIGAKGPGNDVFIGVNRWFAICDMNDENNIHSFFDPNDGWKTSSNKGYGWNDGPFLLKENQNSLSIHRNPNRNELANLSLSRLSIDTSKTLAELPIKVDNGGGSFNRVVANGTIAWAKDATKIGEATGAGTGCMLYFDGFDVDHSKWIWRRFDDSPASTQYYAGVSAKPSVVTFTQSIPLNRPNSLMAHVVNSPLVFTANTAGADPGNGCELMLTADGSNIPDFSAFKKISTSDDYNNTAGQKNMIMFYVAADGTYLYSISLIS